MDNYYPLIIAAIGRLYGRQLQTCSAGKFPRFGGELVDLIPFEVKALPNLDGEYRIMYGDGDTQHTMHVLIDGPFFDVEGTSRGGGGGGGGSRPRQPLPDPAPRRWVDPSPSSRPRVH